MYRSMGYKLSGAFHNNYSFAGITVLTNVRCRHKKRKTGPSLTVYEYPKYVK